jgi:hypothetical protein
MCGITLVGVWNVNCTSPLSAAARAGALPLYGTCSNWIPLFRFSSSPTRCWPLPFPGELKRTEPSFFFASAINSVTEFAGTEGCTVIT